MKQRQKKPVKKGTNRPRSRRKHAPFVGGEVIMIFAKAQASKGGFRTARGDALCKTVSYRFLYYTTVLSGSQEKVEKFMLCGQKITCSSPV
jgi:hypothetical protein